MSSFMQQNALKLVSIGLTVLGLIVIPGLTLGVSAYLDVSEDIDSLQESEAVSAERTKHLQTVQEANAFQSDVTRSIGELKLMMPKNNPPIWVERTLDAHSKSISALESGQREMLSEQRTILREVRNLN